MGKVTQQLNIDEAFERIEETILPAISMVLDTLLDAASLSRPGTDSETYAAELRTIALHLEELIRQVEALHIEQPDQGGYRSASVA